MQRCALRLQRSLSRLDPYFPIEAGRLQQLAPENQDDIDVFLKRFEQMVLTLQDQVFIGLAIREGENPREMSRRDVAELMERLNAVPSARQFRDFVAVRNRLAHLYPEDPARQAANLNAADEAAPLLLRASEQVARLVERQKSTKGAKGGSARWRRRASITAGQRIAAVRRPAIATSPGMTARADLLAARLALFYGAYFAAVGIHLPFWPVWLDARGLTSTEIGYVLAAAFWPRIVTSLLIPALADRFGDRRRPMILLAAVTLVGLVLFGLARDFPALLLLSLITGASWATVLPMGEAVALREAKRRDLSYGRIRLWGSLAFILGAIGVGEWLKRAGPEIVLWSIAGTVAATLAACLLLPEEQSPGESSGSTELRRLVRQPGLLGFVAAAGLIQASHAAYYGFATLHWRAAGHGELVIGLLWAEGVIAEVLLFAAAAPLLRRFPPIRLLALAGGLTTLRWGLTSLSTDLAVLIPAQALHAASFGAVHLAAMHYLRDRTAPELHASAQGFYAAIGTALPFGLMTPIAGWLYGVAGGGVFWAMAAIALLGTGAALFLVADRG